MNVPELVFLAMFVLLARTGLALQVSGLSRAKNAGGALLRVLLDAAVCTIAFWAIGSAILLKAPGNGLCLDPARLLGMKTPPGATGVFYLAMILIGSGVVVGSIVERSKFFVTVVGSLLLAGVLVPIFGYWTWRGWLTGRGVIDVGGAGAVHVCSAVVAWAAAWWVGPRGNKFNRDGSSNMIPGHSLPLACAGLFLTVVAWIPYVVGCSLLHGGNVEPVAMNVLLAGAGGAVMSLLVGKIKYGKPDLMLTFGGLMAGLVAITAGAGNVPGWAALVTGSIAGLILPSVMTWIDLKFRVDDPTGQIAAHLTGGIWGLFSGALFFSVSFGFKVHMLINASLLLAVVVVGSGVVSFVVYGLLHKSVGLRSKESDEFDGLDLAEHDLNAYPDFQQTMIKSYHLREA